MENNENAIPENEEFENADVDPGFDPHTDHVIHGREDKRETNIDSNKSISEMRDKNVEKPIDDLAEPAEGNDALNYKNDRDNGTYNPKNI